MRRNTRRLSTASTDAAINGVLRETSSPKGSGSTVLFYNESEDQFIRLTEPLSVPSLPVHHPIENNDPPPGYRDAIFDLVSYLAEHCPGLVAGTRWSFDPRSIHTPAFYRVEEYGGQAYLYMTLVDLTCRTLEVTIEQPGSNDRTPAYSTKRLYFESDYFPINGVDPDTMVLDQTIPVTWKGESGEGYMIHGIWMDADINKFFSKLLLPEGKRNHPYYPVTCKQHCISMNAYGLEDPAVLHAIRPFLEKNLDAILEELHTVSFSEKSALFTKLKEQFPANDGERWKNLRVSASLNERDQKEYTIEF